MTLYPSKQRDLHLETELLLVPLNATKRIKKLHASNIYTAKILELEEITTFDEQMSYNISVRFLGKYLV